MKKNDVKKRLKAVYFSKKYINLLFLKNKNKILNMSKHRKLKIKKIEKSKCPINIFVYANNY